MKWAAQKTGVDIEVGVFGKAKVHHAWPFAIVIYPAVEEAALSWL